jgi:hypothetical protein
VEIPNSALISSFDSPMIDKNLKSLKTIIISKKKGTGNREQGTENILP